MRKPASMRGLENFGRVRLSRHFYMRDFMMSEISAVHGIPNIPDDPDRAISHGRRLCEELLDPLEQTFGRIAIRSGYRSEALNTYGNLRALRWWCRGLPTATHRGATGAIWRGGCMTICPIPRCGFSPNSPPSIWSGALCRCAASAAM